MVSACILIVDWEDQLMNAYLKKARLLLSIVLLMSAAQLARAQDEENSFRSWNYPDRYIRHRTLLGFLDRITPRDNLGRKDATFKLVPGLAGQCNSLEAVNYPGWYLRHQNFRLKLAEHVEDRLFREDATFCIVPGLANAQGVSFASYNFPDHYIRHLNFELWVNRSDRSSLFMNDATFIVTPPIINNPIEIDPPN